ncbi:hypothetical protein V500_01845 [Pseudogymnoascus sp. VKM F-4518 (FW-2643)]|nr:hypothetical protein V500_01845 [Pseudogymnoascus sp. VKM F-4518 (FW-2643)]
MATMEPVITNKEPLRQIHTLGSVRHRHEQTNEIILIPHPSQNPNDPLNWSQAKKYYMATLICLAMFMCNFVAAGPTIAIVETATDFFPTAGSAGMTGAIFKTAYFFTSTALIQGVGNLFWMPFVNKYGRRPVYLASYTLYLGVALWLSFTTSYSSFLAARILMGLAAGAAETMAPLSIADGDLYTSALSCGVAGGIIIDGLITIHNTWRTIYYIATALIGGLLALVFFTFPETNYNRNVVSVAGSETTPTQEKSSLSTKYLETGINPNVPPRRTYMQDLQILSGTYTSESLVNLFLRPLALIILPPVLWGSLVMSVTIGFLVAVTSNVALAYDAAYGFEAWQTGLCFISAIVGSLIGIFIGGHMSDKMADWFTKRNGGVREPEMRLPSIAYKLHWMCPTVGLGLLNFSIVQATNVSLVYTIDCYRPIAGEITVTTIALKSCFGFLLSFYTNPWVDKEGYLNAFGAMASISSAALLLVVPMYIFGKTIRHVTWHWRVVKFVHWDDDREVGE